MADVEFSGQYDQKLLERAIDLGDPRSRTAKIFSFILLGLFLFNIIWAARDYLAGRLVTFVELAGLLIPLAIIAYLIYHTYRLPVRVAAELWRNPASKVPLAGRITPEGIVVYSSKPETATERLIPWADFSRIRKAEDLVVMTSLDKVLYILPRRFFASQEDWAGFLGLLETHS